MWEAIKRLFSWNKLNKWKLCSFALLAVHKTSLTRIILHLWGCLLSTWGGNCVERRHPIHTYCHLGHEKTEKIRFSITSLLYWGKAEKVTLREKGSFQVEKKRELKNSARCHGGGVTLISKGINCALWRDHTRWNGVQIKRRRLGDASPFTAASAAAADSRF